MKNLDERLRELVAYVGLSWESAKNMRVADFAMLLAEKRAADEGARELRRMQAATVCVCGHSFIQHDYGREVCGHLIPTPCPCTTWNPKGEEHRGD